MAKITHCEVRMYRMGTGDCFILKFLAKAVVQYKIMIDCGTWSGGADHLTPYITNLKEYVDNHIDLLIVTHEHLDHVHVFDACEELFMEDFTIDKIWMAWTENDKEKKVKTFQKEHGDKKKALTLAAERLNGMVQSPAFKEQMNHEYNGINLLASRQGYAEILSTFSEMHSAVNAATGTYVGGLKGMKIVKEKLANDNIEYFNPGDIIDNIAKLPGIKIYVLGPPLDWEDIRVEESRTKGESYEHNNKLAEGNAFVDAILAQGNATDPAVLPFESSYEQKTKDAAPLVSYERPDNAWRKIDDDWLNAAGPLALRINSITNNLSLALAFEFEDSGRVMLFPGDAEYGSWASWHEINWSEPSKNPDVSLTEDLLNRTVFYKVAHHLSHHGTAERLGMEMMTNPDLVAMATLDYDVISSSWLGTMPNRALLKALVTQTRGRFMVMNLEGLFYDLDNTVKLENKIKSERKKMTAKEAKLFKEAAVEDEELYYQFKVSAEKP